MTSFHIHGSHLGALIMETLQEAVQQLVGIVYPLGVLAHDPYHGGASVWLVQGVQVLAQCGDDALVSEERQEVVRVRRP